MRHGHGMSDSVVIGVRIYGDPRFGELQQANYAGDEYEQRGDDA